MYRRIVDCDLAGYGKQNSGITAARLYELYGMFGHDPFVVPTEGAELAEFHAAVRKNASMPGDLDPLTLNQRVPGSSPGAPTIISST